MYQKAHRKSLNFTLHMEPTPILNILKLRKYSDNETESFTADYSHFSLKK